MLDQNKHRTLLFQILKDIFHSDVGQYLAFKGGTACYFLHGLDRFSTDLDFDLLSPLADIDGKIVKILEKYGTVKNGSRMILSYGEKDINIKVDISRKVWKQNEYEIVNFYGTDIRVQTRPTIFANKLMALLERSTNRDIYDVWFFFVHLFDINAGILEERSGKKEKEIYQDIVIKLQNLPKKYNILDGLGEVLTPGQKTFVKTGLIEDLLSILALRIDF